MDARLVCWTCGKGMDIEVAEPPAFAFVVAEWARQVGWVGVSDVYNSRVLVFCSHDCVNMAKKKDGSFRVRPPSLAIKTVGNSRC
jgi:hypothetical protein